MNCFCKVIDWTDQDGKVNDLSLSIPDRAKISLSLTEPQVGGSMSLYDRRDRG